MHRDGNVLWRSPSDLAANLACAHITTLELAVAAGEVARPHARSEYAELIAQKGLEHEAAYLASLREAGREVVDLGDRTIGDAATATEDAMRDGADVIFQGAFTGGSWRGRPDFLERVSARTALGKWGYEAVDTKLARAEALPQHVLQLTYYSTEIERLQGSQPAQMHLVLGTGHRECLRPRDFDAYLRRLRGRFDHDLGSPPPTSPYPVAYCDYCVFRSRCTAEWEATDHLSRVAGITRRQVTTLAESGISTLTGLAELAPTASLAGLEPAASATLSAQAELQLLRTRTGRLTWRPLQPEAGAGFDRLPDPSPGDVVLDLEGDPLWSAARGLEFLFGALIFEDGEWNYRAFWGHDVGGERDAFAALVDCVHARFVAWPDMHLYHYSPAEPTALDRLTIEHTTRMEEVDALHRGGVFCDLFRVTRQAIVAGVGGYGLKEVEVLAEFDRHGLVSSGSQAVLAYERWRSDRDERHLEAIERYNEEDCRSTLALRDWLIARRPAERPPAKAQEPSPISAETLARRAEREALRQALCVEDGGAQLLGDLLDYHRREGRPGWWRHFALRKMTPAELLADREALAGIEDDPGTAVAVDGRSLIHGARFPAQEHKIGPGEFVDPVAEKAVRVSKIDEVARTLRIKRGAGRREEALPGALIPRGPMATGEQQEALARIGRAVASRAPVYRACRDIVARATPRFVGQITGCPIQTVDLAAQQALARSLDESYLVVQGPPGTGKTWRGARLVVDLIRAGRKVGVSATSHRAIENMLKAIEVAATEMHVVFRGLKKATDDPETRFDGAFISSVTKNDEIEQASDEVRLVAGTAWLFARPGLDASLDVLVIDEAGQVSLADALAMATSARNVILLGDPLQLAQVSQAAHPSGAEASVLDHLIGSGQTIATDRGVFLESSWRMHPDLCGVISDEVYDGRLRAEASCARQGTSHGTGIRFLPVVHRDNSSRSMEEADAIAAEIERLTGGEVTDERGRSRPIAHGDFMVVSPYNAQVQLLRSVLPEGIKVGTVDKFQGQEAPIVFFSMATSSAADAPRDLAFLFSRNRLNVAISRARCLAFIVCSPELLSSPTRTLDEMRLVNTLCRMVERTSGGSAA